MLELSMMNLPANIEQNRIKSVVQQLAVYADIQPDKAAIVVCNRLITYGQLYDLARGFCMYLQHQGLNRGSFVVCRATPALDYWIAYFGVQLAGGVFVPLEKDCAAEALLSTLATLDNVFAVLTNENDETLLGGHGYKSILFSSINELAESHSHGAKIRQFPDENDLGQILFTTGTTGKAKGTMLSHKYMTQASYSATAIPYGPSTVMVVPAPMNHVLAVGRCSCVLLHGGTIVFVDGLSNIAEFYDAFSIHKANAATLTPSALNYIIALTGEDFVEYSKQLKFIEIGGEKLPRKQQDELISLLPSVRLFIMYASTETGAACYYEFSKHGSSDNRIGQPTDGLKVLFMDENWQEVSAAKDDPGFIVIKSDRHMQGYWKDEEATNKVMHGDLIMMSDYGYVDDQGYICLAGRAGDVIISGGYKINPTEVENAVLSAGTIFDCVCFGVRDEVFGRLVKILVVMKDGEKFDRYAIGNHLKSRLEGYKTPKIIEQTDRIIRNANGKINRKAYEQKA